MVVVKDLNNSLFRIAFRLFLIIFVWRECRLGKVHLMWRGGYEDIWGAEIVGVGSGGFEKWMRTRGGRKIWL